MRKFTLDTSAVIAGSNAEPLGQWIDGLIQLAREGQLDLAVTTAFGYDQRGAGDERQRVNLAYLAPAPVVTVPGPFTLGVSAFDSGDVLGSEADVDLQEKVRAILTAGKKTGGMKQAHDIHHLVAHRRAGRDVFVTSDHDDMARAVTRDRLLCEVGIVVITPEEARRLALTPED